MTESVQTIYKWIVGVAILIGVAILLFKAPQVLVEVAVRLFFVGLLLLTYSLIVKYQEWSSRPRGRPPWEELDENEHQTQEHSSD